MIQFSKEVIVVSYKCIPGRINSYVGQIGKASFNPSPRTCKKFPFKVKFNNPHFSDEIFMEKEIQNL